MSIGPQNSSSEPKVKKYDRLRYAVKTTVKKYFEKPSFYLFYSMLALTILGLFFGMSFNWQYYTILIILFLTEVNWKELPKLWK